jgi:hypothetical protein
MFKTEKSVHIMTFLMYVAISNLSLSTGFQNNFALSIRFEIANNQYIS